MAKALTEAGYEPRHLSATYSETGDLVLVARLDRRAPTPARDTTVARIAIGVGLGLVLGFFGLPRLELPRLSQPQDAPAPTPVVVSQAVAQVAPVEIPTQPPPPPTTAPVPTPAALLSVGPFTSPIQGWTNDPAEIGDRGDIGVWQRDQTRWIDIVPWTHSDAVNLDRQQNELSVITHGDSLEVQVNGQTVVNLAYDRLPPSGGVGIFTGGDLNEVALDWLRIDNSR